MNESEKIMFDMREQEHGHSPVVCFQQNQREEVRDMGDCAGAITAESGMHNTNYVVYAIEGNVVDRVSRRTAEDGART